MRVSRYHLRIYSLRYTTYVSMSPVQILKLPAEFRRPLNGICVIKQNTEDTIVAWYENNIVLFTAKGSGSGSACRTVSVEETVRLVFECDTSIFCVDMSGAIYSLKFVKNDDDVDIFDSSADEDEVNCAPLVASFVPSIVIKNIVCISPLHSGFILLMYGIGKLYIEIYDSYCNGSDIRKTSSIELCTGCDMVIKQCILKVYKADDMTLALRQQFLKTIYEKNVSVVLLGLPTGTVYYVVVSSANNRILSPPNFLYTCPYSVFAIVALKNSQTELFSKIGIVLTHGIIVIVSNDIIFGSLNYSITNIPSHPQVMVEIENSFFFSDGLDFWHCSLNESNSSIDSKMLNIKGVCFIAKYYGKGNILIATVHETWYTLTVENSSLINCIKSSPSYNISVHEISQSLYKELLEIEVLKREICHEENFISSLSIFSRNVMFEKFFTSEISVTKLSCASSEDFLLKFCDSNFEEVLQEKNSLLDLYLFVVQVENKSELEFSSQIWSILTEIRAKDVIIQKCEKLFCTLTSGSNFSSSIYVQIEQPFLGVTLSLSLVAQLPENNSKFCGKPWLTIPILVKDLGFSYFIKNSITLVPSSNDAFMEAIASLTQKIKPEVNLISLIFKNCFGFEANYLYKFSVSKGSHINEFWSLIRHLCKFKHALEENENIESNPIGNTFSIYIGKLKVDFTLKGQNVQLSTNNPSLLMAVKDTIISKWALHCNTMQNISLQTSIIARALLYKEKLQLERLNCSKSEYTLLKNGWRGFVSECMGV